MKPFKLKCLRLLVLFCPLLWSGNLLGQGAGWHTGITEPIRDATLSSPVPGIIGKYHFREGQFVEEGKIILELDKRLEELEVARTTIVLQTNLKALERVEYLFKNTQSVSPETIDRAKAECELARAQLDLAEIRKDLRTIKAPFSGIVTDVFDLEAGEGCQSQQPLVRLVDSRQCVLVCNVESEYGHLFRPNDEVEIQISGAPSALTFAGRLTFVSPVVDPASGLLKIKATFENLNQGVRPGVVGRLRPKEPVRVN